MAFDSYGLHQLSRDLKTFKDYRFTRNIQDGLMAIKETTDGIMYVGNWRSGLRVYDEDEDSFKVITDQNGLLRDDTQVSGISIVSDTLLWLNTNMGLIQHDLSNRQSSEIEINEIESHEITSDGFFTATNGFSYIGTSQGYIKYLSLIHI